MNVVNNSIKKEGFLERAERIRLDPPDWAKKRSPQKLTNPKVTFSLLGNGGRCGSRIAIGHHFKLCTLKKEFCKRLIFIGHIFMMV